MSPVATSNIPCARPAVRAIAERLKDMFDSIASDPLPANLLSLVDQLEAAYQLETVSRAAPAAPIRD